MPSRCLLRRVAQKGSRRRTQSRKAGQKDRPVDRATVRRACLRRGETQIQNNLADNTVMPRRTRRKRIKRSVRGGDSRGNRVGTGAEIGLESPGNFSHPPSLVHRTFTGLIRFSPPSRRSYCGIGVVLNRRYQWQFPRFPYQIKGTLERVFRIMRPFLECSR